MKQKIIDTMIYIIAIITVILILIFQTNKSMVLLIASIGGILLGLCFTIQNKKHGILIISLCISLLLSTILYKNKTLTLHNSLTFFISLSIASMLLITFIVEFINRKIISKIYTIKQQATVIDLKKYPNSKKEYYQPIYEYEIDNNIYHVEYPDYKQKFIPNIGDKKDIYIDPNNYEEIYFKPEIKDDLFKFFIGLILIIACLIILVGLF